MARQYRLCCKCKAKMLRLLHHAHMHHVAPHQMFDAFADQGAGNAWLLPMLHRCVAAWHCHRQLPAILHRLVEHAIRHRSTTACSVQPPCQYSQPPSSTGLSLCVLACKSLLELCHGSMKSSCLSTACRQKQKCIDGNPHGSWRFSVSRHFTQVLCLYLW